MLQIQLLLSMIVLVVRIELLYSSICRLPSNRANGVAVLEGSPMLMLIHITNGLSKIVFKMYGYIPYFLTKDDNLCAFLFASLPEKRTLSKKGSTLKGKDLLQEEQILFFQCLALFRQDKKTK